MVVKRTWTNKFLIPESKNTEITESFPQYQRVTNQDLCVLCVSVVEILVSIYPTRLISLFLRSSGFGFS